MEFGIFVTFSLLVIPFSCRESFHHDMQGSVAVLGKTIAKHKNKIEETNRKLKKDSNRCCKKLSYNIISLGIAKWCPVAFVPTNGEVFEIDKTNMHVETTERSNGNLDEYLKLRKEDLVSTKAFPAEDICSYQSLRVRSSEISSHYGNTFCLPSKQNTSCEFATNFARKSQKFITKVCPRDSSIKIKQICWFREDHRTSSVDLGGLQCNTLPCQSVYLGVFNTSIGNILPENYWPSFNDGKDLERAIAEILALKYSNHFRFCFLKCRVHDVLTPTVKQILVFPPIVANTHGTRPKPQINVNILVEDAVSRDHLYRALPKTVDALRDIIYDPSLSTTVLDFELYQSYDSSTHSNMQRLFSGAQNWQKESLTQGIINFFKRYKESGYQTMFQEDACWFEGFGSLLRSKKNAETSEDDLTKEWRELIDELLDNKTIFDTFGVGFSSCKILNDLGDLNIFNSVKLPMLCFSGRYLSDYYLENVQRFLEAHYREQVPVFSYVHLNTGHEHTGERIINDDNYLAKFFKSVARYNNTLTIFLSDHGGKTTDYAIHTAEGLKEIYKPFLFMIVPHGVAKAFGNKRMRNLIQNQKRLVALEDLHLALLDLAVNSDPKISNIITSNIGYKHGGLFSEIPVTRSCSDFELSADTVCLCEGDEIVAKLDELFLYFLGKLAVGEINNLVQSQYMKGKTTLTEMAQLEYRQCQRYMLKEVERVRCKVKDEHKLCTLTVVVETTPKSDREEIFEVTLSYTLIKRSGVDLVKLTRLSRYSDFKTCADSQVDVCLCTCVQNFARKLKNSEYVWKIFSQYMFSSPAQIRKLHGSCLYSILTRKRRFLRNGKGQDEVSVYEVINVCVNESFALTVTQDSLVRKPFMLSSTLPIQIIVYPNTMHYVVSASCGLPSGTFIANFKIDVIDI